MQLLDVVNLVDENGHAPDSRYPRECAVSVDIFDVCDDAHTPIKVVTAGEPDLGQFKSFPLIARFNGRVACASPDDPEWLAKQLRLATEVALGKALVAPPYAGATNWIGDAGVAQQADVIAGRAHWAANHVIDPGALPVLHVAPELLPGLIDQDIVRFKNDETYTVWGDPVVVNAGYAGFPSFWSGNIAVYLSPIAYEDEIYRNLRANTFVLQAIRTASVDMAPCTVVRNGAMPV